MHSQDHCDAALALLYGPEVIPAMLVKGALEHFGRIDALLNIAGAVPQIDLFEMTDAQWDDGLTLKLHGARRLTIRAGASVRIDVEK
jgi:NAD(P)-dependent dehydrogenase (short-subunit alcohol dehydrogenase family)